MDNVQDALGECRAQIDVVDQQLMHYLARRFELSRTIGILKHHKDAQVFQPDRAKEVKDRYVDLGTAHGIPASFVMNLFELIHDESCRVQSAHKMELIKSTILPDD